MTTQSRGEEAAKYAVGSQDFDCLLFGAPLLVRNLTSSEKRKLPNKQAFTTVHPEQIRLEPGLQKLGVSREQLVDIAILIGTDFKMAPKVMVRKKVCNFCYKKDL